MKRPLKDLWARRGMSLLSLLPGLLVLLIVLGLFLKSKAILGVQPLSRLLFGTDWHPLQGHFGLFPFISGTVWVTVTALVLAVPISILTAIYLSEFAPRFVREVARPVIDLLAGLPSVVFGVWGVILIVPFVGDVLAPLFGASSTGYSVLAGGIVLRFGGGGRRGFFPRHPGHRHRRIDPRPRRRQRHRRAEADLRTG